MSKRPEPPPDEAEGWLVSYADMMTLIACFFILMMAFANYDPVSFNQKAEEFAENFNQKNVNTSMIEFKHIKQEITKHEIKEKLKISIKGDELIVSFSTSVLYRNGQYKLAKDSEQTLDALIDILKISNNNYRILIEGHSDDDLTKTTLQDQWHISLLRASYIASRFQFFGFPAVNIVPVGRGDTQKISESTNARGERNEDIARLNRRVVIRVLEPYKKQKIKLGLGVYFRDATDDVNENEIPKETMEKFDVD